MTGWPWSTLGLDGPTTEAEIRRAYAIRLRDVRPDEDAAGFQSLVEARDAAMLQVAAAVSNYYSETNTYPASLSALYAAPGYEYLQSVTIPFQSYALTTGLTDGNFQFNRAVVYSQDGYSPAFTDTDLLSSANNTCGTGAFATATEWCGPNDSTVQWYKHESREQIASDLARERRRLFRLLQKFNAWYNDDVSVSTTPGVMGNNYPNPGSPAATLTSLVTGFSQTAKTCSGIYSWKNIPIDCTDLYSVWGSPTVYNYLSATHIVLITQTPYTKADGTPLYVSTEESL